jgi:ribonuclease Z
LNTNGFTITFLGTSAASINPHSPTSTCLVEVGDTKILVDAGIGAMRQLGRIRVDPDGIDAVLITHWHFDHYAGLPAFLQSRGSSSSLSIYGPRLSIPARIFLLGFLRSAHIHFETTNADFSKDCGAIRVEAVPTVHDVVSVGWVLTERATGEQRGKRRTVISGDTRPAPTIVDAARGADLLVHEATYLDNHANRAYTHKHSTVAEAAALAAEAGVGALALTHIAHRYPTLSVLNEAERIFPTVFVPSPLDRIYIEPVPEISRTKPFGWGRVMMVPHLNP